MAQTEEALLGQEEVDAALQKLVDIRDLCGPKEFLSAWGIDYDAMLEEADASSRVAVQSILAGVYSGDGSEGSVVDGVRRPMIAHYLSGFALGLTLLSGNALPEGYVVQGDKDADDDAE